MALTLRMTPNGWLAVGDTYPRIGVMGETEEAARENFERRLKQWEALGMSMPAEKNRSGSEVRKRPYQVGVRLLPDEWNELHRTAEREGVSPAEVLRRAFLKG